MADDKKDTKKVVLEREYNIPLRKGWLKVPLYKRSKKAVKVLREFLEKHMKSDDVRLGMHLNEHVWKHGIRNPPHHVKVKAVKYEDNVVKAELEGFEFKEAVKAKPKEEKPEGLKGKLQEALGKKEKTVEEKAEDKKEPDKKFEVKEKKSEEKEKPKTKPAPRKKPTTKKKPAPKATAKSKAKTAAKK